MSGPIDAPSVALDDDERRVLAGVTDQELTMLALAADPDGPVADGPSFWELTNAGDRSPLPSWYMPARFGGLSGRRSRWRRPVAVLLLVSFLLIEGYGLCTTYGPTVLR